MPLTEDQLITQREASEREAVKENIPPSSDHAPSATAGIIRTLPRRSRSQRRGRSRSQRRTQRRTQRRSQRRGRGRGRN